MTDDKLFEIIRATVPFMEDETGKKAYQASFAGGRSGLSFGSMQIDVAATESREGQFRDILVAGGLDTGRFGPGHALDAEKTRVAGPRRIRDAHAPHQAGKIGNLPCAAPRDTQGAKVYLYRERLFRQLIHSLRTG